MRGLGSAGGSPKVGRNRLPQCQCHISLYRLQWLGLISSPMVRGKYFLSKSTTCEGVKTGRKGPLTVDFWAFLGRPYGSPSHLRATPLPQDTPSGAPDGACRALPAGQAAGAASRIPMMVARLTPYRFARSVMVVFPLAAAVRMASRSAGEVFDGRPMCVPAARARACPA